MMRALSTSLSRLDCEWATWIPKNKSVPMVQKAIERQNDNPVSKSTARTFFISLLQFELFPMFEFLI